MLRGTTAIETGIDLAMVPLGGRSKPVSAATPHGFALAVDTDAERLRNGSRKEADESGAFNPTTLRREPDGRAAALRLTPPRFPVGRAR